MFDQTFELEEQTIDSDKIVAEYKELLTVKFTNSNQFVIDLKAAQAAQKRMELEGLGVPADDLRSILSQAKTDAVCYLMMELSEFLGDQMLVRKSKSTKAFLQWGIKQMIEKLKDLGISISQNDMNRMSLDACLSRIEVLNNKKSELALKLKGTEAAEIMFSSVRI